MVDTKSPPAAVAVDRDELILEHIPLLKHIVGKLSVDLSTRIDRDDMYGFGMIGLISAADSWDSSRGLKFSTYAYTRIRGAILDELRRQDFLPRNRRERVRDLDRAVAALEQRTGSPPAPEEIAEHMDITLEELDEIFLSSRSGRMASLDEGPEGDWIGRLSDPRSDDPVGSLEWQETRDRLKEAILELSEQEQTIINLYYAEDLLLREISEIVGLTESRISQIHTRALYRLNRAMERTTRSRP